MPHEILGPRKKLDYDGGPSSPHVKRQYSQTKFDRAPAGVHEKSRWAVPTHNEYHNPHETSRSPSANRTQFLTTNQDNFRYLFGERVENEPANPPRNWVPETIRAKTPTARIIHHKNYSNIPIGDNKGVGNAWKDMYHVNDLRDV